jgi:hypothetical protein
MPVMIGGYLLADFAKEAQMKWIMAFWTSIVSVLMVISALAWREMLKTERAVRPYIDDIPFRPNGYRHRDDDHLR